MFIKWTLEDYKKNVRYTTVTDFLLWLTGGDLTAVPPHSNIIRERTLSCTKPISCETTHNPGNDEAVHTRYFRTCHRKCPDQYPWLTTNEN
jgi:hypothetical protein